MNKSLLQGLSLGFMFGGSAQLPYAMFKSFTEPSFNADGTILIAITFFAIAIYLKISVKN